MRRLLLPLFLLFVFLGVQVVFIPSTYAVDVTQEVCETNAANKPTFCNDVVDSSAIEDNPLYGPDGILTVATRIMSIVVGVISFIVLIISGIKMSLSSGNSSKIETARNQIIYAIVGIVVALLAQALVRFVLSKIGI